MKIYEITNEGESTKYCNPQLMGRWFYEPLFMNCREDLTIPLPVTTSVNNKYKPEDYPIARTKLVSKKLFEIIKTLNRNYEALPTQMYYKEKEQIWDIYYSMLFPEYELFNWKKSKYEVLHEYVGVIDELVLSKEKVVALPPENNLFCLKEKTTRLLCTEKAKKTIKEAGITGIAFDELEVL